MNREESIAQNYLRKQNVGLVCHEPDGNVTPDFLVDGRVAVEVRRLNENVFKGNKVEGSEIESIRLWQSIESLLKSYTKDADQKTYWVSIEFKRPLKGSKKIKKELSKILDNFLNKPSDQENTFTLDSNLKVTIRYIGKVVELDNCRFVLDSEFDNDIGGFLVPRFIKNLEYCIQEKTDKIERFKSKYDEWWLLLCDKIAYGFSVEEEKIVSNHDFNRTSWDKIIVLDSNSGEKIIEL